jgi:hypothetical protein
MTNTAPLSATPTPATAPEVPLAPELPNAGLRAFRGQSPIPSHPRDLSHCRVPWTAMTRATQLASASDFASEAVPSRPPSRPPMP